MKVKPISFVTKKKLAELTGYTVAAIETKARIQLRSATPAYAA